MFSLETKIYIIFYSDVYFLICNTRFISDIYNSAVKWIKVAKISQNHGKVTYKSIKKIPDYHIFTKRIRVININNNFKQSILSHFLEHINLWEKKF